MNDSGVNVSDQAGASQRRSGEDRHLHVVVGYPSSDIGKGWTAAGIGSGLGLTTAMIKIDPMLNAEFPPQIGTALDGAIVSDDAATYLGRGLRFSPEMNIVMGEWMAQVLGMPAVEGGLLDNNPLKITYVDLAYRMADHIHGLIDDANCVVEVGGCPDDDEAFVIAHAVRILMSLYDYRTWLHVVTTYDAAENRDGPTFKIRTPVRAVRLAMRVYHGVSIQNLRVYVRRAGVTGAITDGQLRSSTTTIAFKLGVRPDQVMYIPNLGCPEELDAHIK